jgi:hypothetical protein
VSGETICVLLPAVEKVEVQAADYEAGVRPKITLDWTKMPTFCAHLRELAQDFDPQDIDEERRMIRIGVEQVGMLKHAIEHVIRFYDAGDRGTALHEAIRYLKQTVIDVNVL